MFFVYKRLYEEKDPSLKSLVVGNCITIMHQPHSAHVVQQFLAKHGIPVVSQPLYSPDLAPCDFFLFPKIKMALKGKRFQDVDEIKQNVTEELRRVSKNDFYRCFQKWQER
jgi:transposase